MKLSRRFNPSIGHGVLLHGRLLASCLAAVVIMKPLMLQAQTASADSAFWLTYRGNTEGTYTATCRGDAGEVPKAGRVAIMFYGNGDWILRTEWYADGRAHNGNIKDKVAADGTARGEVAIAWLGWSTWWGRFRQLSDGTIEGKGSISPSDGDPRGCTGTWEAKGGTSRAPATAPSCAEYLNRIQASNLAYSQKQREMMGVLERTEADRSSLASMEKYLTKVQSDPAGPDADWHSRRAFLISEINSNRKKVADFEAQVREHYKLRAEARAAGCDISADPPLPPKRDIGNYLDHLSALSSPITGEYKSDVLGVAGVNGSVEMESSSAKGPLRDGHQITLDPNSPVTIRTGPGSSATIQVGPVRRTLRPMTTLKVFPHAGGQPDFLEQGSATVDVQQPVPAKVQTPSATASVGGTVYRISYDPATQTTGVGVEEGRVTVVPTNPSLRTVTLGPGEYVEVSMTAVSRVLPAPGATATAAQPPVPPNVEPRGDPRVTDLTGFWVDDTGGGAVYRIRQHGVQFYWIVDGTPMGSFVNMAFGTISGNAINAEWIDLPGSPSLGNGHFTLRIESNNRIVKASTSVGNYGARAWTRQGSTQGPSPVVAPPPVVATPPVIVPPPVVSRPAATPAPTASPSQVSVWQYQIAAQAAWTGTMTRRGSTNVYDVQLYDTYKNPMTMVHRVVFQGDRVFANIERASDGMSCTAEGKLSADGITFVSTSTCSSGPSGWMWRITPAGKPWPAW